MNQKQSNGPGYKLTSDQIMEIRLLEGKMTVREIGKKFGVSHNTIHLIHRQKMWKTSDSRKGADQPKSASNEEVSQTAKAKHGRKEIYTKERLNQIVDMLNSGIPVKIAVEIINKREGLNLSYVPLLVAAKRHGYNLRDLVEAAKRRGVKFRKSSLPVEERTAGDLVSDLLELTKLKIAGALTQDEFTKAKAKILGK